MLPSSKYAPLLGLVLFLLVNSSLCSPQPFTTNQTTISSNASSLLSNSIHYKFHTDAQTKIVYHSSLAINFTLSQGSDSRGTPLTGLYRFRMDQETSFIAAQITETNETFVIDQEDLHSDWNSYNGIVRIYAKFLGYSTLSLERRGNGSEWEQLSGSAIVFKIEREENSLSLGVNVLIFVVLGLTFSLLGWNIDVSAVLETVKKPVSLIISLGCQFILSPLVSRKGFRGEGNLTDLTVSVPP